jgi:hypothetical protein
MSALGIGLAWVGLATLAFLVLSAGALARGRHELEADPWVSGEPEPRGIDLGGLDLAPRGANLVVPRATARRRHEVTHGPPRRVLADLSV